MMRKLTNRQLEQLLGRKRLDELSLARFGGVMTTKAALAGDVAMMFREKPEWGLPFSGWVFVSSKESANASAAERGLELHEAIAVLRVAPEVASYLGLPPGTILKRAGTGAFVKQRPKEGRRDH